MANRLVKSIESLIVDHDCVVVPRFGAFFREILPATYSQEYGVVSPPTCVVRFNESIQHQDPLLLEYYKYDLGLSRRQAKLQLDLDIQNLKQQLVQQQTVALHGLGKLRLDPEGALSFSAEAGDYINMMHYGLKPVSPHSRVLGCRRNVPSKTKSKYVSLYIPKRPLKYVGVVAVLLLVMLLPFSLWRAQLPSYEASFVPMSYGARVSTNVAPKEVQPVVTQVDQNEAYWAEAQVGMNYIIIGVERKKEIAERYIALYQKKYPNLKILEDTKQYRISAESFANKDEAYRYLAKLKNNKVSAWIYSR